ncbi:c2h2 finger domain containing protein [Sporothrix brasiliensis 5110]|uniref:C2h2 finger domain containing protein n=1 Tax=Sporothrix brasiliensis 5110 TaxID=1398154 RepID=A0A0C2J845_9PEZI|nr:c2h2 finger domain containing protein [Sporothrix brasiliensis 5110]KIH95155.1 c2h2 finger domain containing protein [Sporothrix brasiliensis 5110]
MDMPMDPSAESASAIRDALGLHVSQQPQQDGTAHPTGSDLSFYVFEQQHQHDMHPPGTDAGGLVAPDGTTSHRSFAGDDTYAVWSQDPMDLDYDPELASWVSSWDAPPPHQTVNTSHRQQTPALAQMSPTIPSQHQNLSHQHHHQQLQQLQQMQPPQRPLPQQPLSQQRQQQHQHQLALRDQLPVLQQHQQQQLPQQQEQQQQQQHQFQQLQHTQSFSSSQASVASFEISSLPSNFADPDLNKTGKIMGPDDFLFPDDETAAVLSNQVHTTNVQQNTHQGPSILPSPAAAQPSGAQLASAAGLDLNEPATLELYDDLLIFSRGSHLAGDKLTFDSCDAAKEAVLHRLALKFKLSYSYDPVQRKAVIWRSSVFGPVNYESTPAIVSQPPTVPSQLAPQPTPTFASDIRSAPPASPASAAPPPATPAVPSSLGPQPAGSDGSPPKRPTITPPVIFPLVQQDTNTVGLSVGLTPPPARRLSNDSSAAASVVSSLALPGQGFPGEDDKTHQDTPSLGDRLSSSWSIFHSGISSRRPRGRRGPLSAKSRKDIKDLEWAGAILAAENVVDDLTGGPPPGQPDVVSHCFREAEMQCLSDNKLVLDNPALFLRTHGHSVAAHHFSQSIRNGRYRANESLNVTCQAHETSSTYSDLISSIAWELADNNECLNVLEIESVESFMMLLETACLYEVEVGKSPMVSLSLVCLRNCLDALRLNSAHILDARLHSTCQSDRCSINCLRELANCIDTYIEELSLLMFRKVNLRDRRWWLSTFYSLCIQAYVRRALLVIEQQLLYPDSDDADVLYSSQYLHLVTVLFIAVSFQYDPLVSSSGGLQLQQSLLAEEDGASSDMFVPDRYFAAGRSACAVHIWLDEGIKSSYQFLTRLLNIGSLDFDMGQVDGGAGAGGDVNMEGSDAVLPLRRLRGIKSESYSAYSSPNSSTTSFASSLSAPRSTTGVISPPSSVGPMSSASSPRTSLLMTERRSSIGSLPSRLSAASFPSFNPGTIAATPITSLPLPSKPGKGATVSHGKAGSIVSESGCSSVGSTATATNVLAPSGDDNTSGAAASGMTVTDDEGQLVCTCCPKRPQRFNTMEELKVHQTKKPHICAFCGRRFSRMNEAERHITTIHLRPFSWSCRRLATPLLAFQRVSDGTTTYDVCGFCGRQFQRPASLSSNSGGDSVAGANDKAAHDQALTLHIEIDHKLHDCKASAKKFYREDMFGQHLKLSHAAEPGVWLKYLENACKAEEKEAGIQPTLAA